jgi:hypothetical protein
MEKPMLLEAEVDPLTIAEVTQLEPMLVSGSNCLNVL